MPLVSLVGLVAVQILVALFAARAVGGGKFLAAVLLLSSGLRTIAALALYLISALHLPFLESLQFQEGFWRFAYDAPHYHDNAARIAEAISAGLPLPQVLYDNRPFLVDSYDFFYLVALLYWALGTHPLVVPFLNSIFWAVTGAIAFAIARRLAGQDNARIAAVLVSFWPSTFMWSSQILKDSLILACLIALFLLILLLASAKRKVALGMILALVPVFFVIARIREELALVLVGSVAIWIGLRLITRQGVGLPLGVASLALLAILWASPSLDVVPSLYSLSSYPKDAPAAPVPGLPTSEAPSGSATVQVEPVLPPTPPRPIGERILERLNILELLSEKRAGFASTGGGSAFATEVELRTVFDVVTFLPQGLLYAALAPFPWEAPLADGDTGIFKSVSRIETLLLLLLTPCIVLGAVTAMRRGSSEAVLLLVFATLSMVGFALTITNIGVLFRLRLQALIPLIILASAYGMPLHQLRSLLRTMHLSRPGWPWPLAAPRPE